MRVYFDMDGVLADLLHGWLPYLNEITGKNLTHADVDMWGLEKVYGIPFSKIRKPLHKPGFWENLPPYPGAIEYVLNLHSRGYQIYIATTPFPSDNCAWEKKLWFEQHLPFLAPTRLILIHDKHLLWGDALIDDKPENLVGFMGKRILMNQPWNVKLNDGLKEHMFLRVNTWRDITVTLMEI